MKTCQLLSFNEAVGSLYSQIILSASLRPNLTNHGLLNFKFWSFLSQWKIFKQLSNECLIAGAAGILWFAAWQLVVHESPTVHPTISDEEKHYIEKSFDQGNVRIPGLLCFHLKRNIFGSGLKALSFHYDGALRSIPELVTFLYPLLKRVFLEFFLASHQKPTRQSHP